MAVIEPHKPRGGILPRTAAASIRASQVASVAPDRPSTLPRRPVKVKNTGKNTGRKNTGRKNTSTNCPTCLRQAPTKSS